jgi:hypothetical protein
MNGERAQNHDSRGSDGHKGNMSDMNSMFHQSVSMNVKGGYFLLIRLVLIDANH